MVGIDEFSLSDDVVDISVVASVLNVAVVVIWVVEEVVWIEVVFIVFVVDEGVFDVVADESNS